MKKTNVVAMADPLDALDMMTALCETEELEARREFRRREHRREKKLRIGVDAAFVAVLCACCFIIGYCVGGMA